MEPANPLEPGYLTQPGYPAQPATGPDQGQLVPPARAVPPRAPSPGVQPAPPNQMPNQAQPSLAPPGPMPNQVPGEMSPQSAQLAQASASEALVPPAQPVAAPSVVGGPAPDRAPGQPPANASRAASAEDTVALASLTHMPIVDLGTGRRVGRVDDIILSADYRSVEAYASHSGFLRGTQAFPARGATLGPDAITLPPGTLDRFDKRSLRGLPLAGGLAGTRLLSDGGRVLGTVKDLRMDPRTAEVVGYEVTPEDRGLLDRLRHHTVLLPVAEVRQRGTDAWIVAEDDARQHFG